MWKPPDQYGDGPFVPKCSFCGRSLPVNGMHSKTVRGITRYFAANPPLARSRQL